MNRGSSMGALRFIGNAGAAVLVTEEERLPIADTGTGLKNSDWHYGFVEGPVSDYILQTSVGAEGDFLLVVTIEPLSETPGDVSLTNGDGSAELIYNGTLMPVGVPYERGIHGCSRGGPWVLDVGVDLKVSFSGLFS